MLNFSFKSKQIWAPPTPPQDENDIYFDYAMNYTYETTIMAESELPPIYVPREAKRIRLDSLNSGMYFCFLKMLFLEFIKT